MSVGFSDLCDLDAKALAEKIVVRLQVLGLDCIAQCYDGVSVMSGQVSGVQQRLREIVEMGVFTSTAMHTGKENFNATCM